jgi:tetratricopeptide (TPR) repeat protein
LTWIVYFPALSNGFVNWDDPETILENRSIRSLSAQSLKWMLTTFHTGNWIPLTWFTHALNYRLWGPDPRMHHLTNLVLHSLNTALLFFFSLQILTLARSTGSLVPAATSATQDLATASFGALLLGIHPIHVESVAWVTERKGLLCAFFFFLSLIFYLRYASARSREPGKLALCLILFVLALLSKPMAVTLPVVLLILDGWPLRRLTPNFLPVLLEKVPFFAVSAIFALVTMKAQAAAGAIATVEALSLKFRIMNAFHSMIFYPAKMLAPFNLLPFYPVDNPEKNVFTAENLASAALVLLICYVCFLYRARRPYLAAAWLYYLVTLAPVLGVLQVGSQTAADRYAYIPSISLYLLFSAAAVSLLLTWKPGPELNLRLTGLMLGSGLLVLIWLTAGQIKIWKESQTLWERVVHVFPDVSQMAHTNLANAYRKAGRLDEAIREYRRGLALPPEHAFTHDGLGTALLDKGLVDESIQEFQKAIALDSRYASARRNLWFAYNKKGMVDEALDSARKAVEIDPKFAEAYSNLGISYGYKGEFEKSGEAFSKALELDPHNPEFLANLATTYQRSGKLSEAIELYKRANALNPREPVYLVNLGNTYERSGELSNAIESFESALRINPGLAQIHARLARLYSNTNQMELARSHYEQARSQGAPVDSVLEQQMLGGTRPRQ